jgi:hypothetical protein
VSCVDWAVAATPTICSGFLFVHQLLQRSLAAAIGSAQNAPEAVADLDADVWSLSFEFHSVAKKAT